MSQYGLIYRLELLTADTVRANSTYNADAKQITVNIYDTEVLIADDADPTVIDLVPAMPTFTVESVNNDQDKFAPILAKQATLRFLSDRGAGITIMTFAGASDNRFYVEAKLGALFILKGFAMLSDMEQDFMPDPTPIEMIVSDHLALLKDVPLVDFAGLNPTGKYRIVELIAMALKPTGLNLPIKVINNLQHGSGSRSMTIVFVGSPDDISVANTDAYFFYVGQEVTITGSASNDGTYHVASLETGFVTVVRFVETITPEASVSVMIADQSTGHFYDKQYLDAKTFEGDDINKSQDCYTVLTAILKRSCQLFQWEGAWWIRRIDEVENGLLYPAQFEIDGSFTGYLSAIQPNVLIGDNSPILDNANRGTKIRPTRPYKSAKLTFKYQTPKEIVCNKDFARGAVITPPDLSAADGTGTYNLDCWTLRRLSGSITSTVFVTRKFIYGVEDQRYATITPASATSTPYDFIESQAIELFKNDKCSISIDFKYDTDFGSGGVTVYPMRVYLKGDDGNWWYWWHPTSNNIDDFYWTNAGASEVERLIPMTWDAGSVDETQFRSLSVDIGALPVSGKLYIGLNQGNQVATGGSNQNINYQGLQFDYKPYINGSYELFTGQSNQITRTDPDNYSSLIDDEVFIANSPRKEFKGALFYKDSNGVFWLCGNFYSAAAFAMTTPTDAQFFHPYGYIQCYDVWNQFRNGMITFALAAHGLLRQTGASPDFWPDLGSKVYMITPDASTNNRVFVLISFNQDWKTTVWTATIIEVYNTYLGKVYTDPLVFAYLTS